MFTINEAAAATGWSPRMLRYVEQLGLVAPTRSEAGYRLYSPPQVERLRSLRTLLDTQGLELAQVGFALRLRTEPELATALDTWFETSPARADSPPDTAQDSKSDADWLAFEQDKQQHLLTH